MTTDREIKRLALELCPHYCYGTPYYLNAQTDRMRAKHQMPACLHMQTTDGTVETEAGPFFQADRRTRRVQVGFADAVKFDQDPEKTLEVVESLLDMGRALIDRMNDSGMWERITTYDYQVLYNPQDGNLVWVLLSFSATETAAMRCDA